MQRRAVNMVSDGLALTPGEYAGLLARLDDAGKISPDNYGEGGSVAALETAMAKVLGKPAALLMPTGTMANLLAVQYLAGTDPKVIVQHESHLYNDCGDCAASLSGLQLVPAGTGATFTPEDVAAVLERARAGKVDAAPGVVSIETPVRRLDGAMFDFAAMAQVAELARMHGLQLHLDGARLPVAAACTGRPMGDYTGLFDTVYVSLYKCFNSLSGAIVAGQEDLITRLFHWRRRNGGGMARMWPMAAVGLHYLPGVVGRLTKAFGIAEEFFGLLAGHERFAIVLVKGGSSVFGLTVAGAGREELETLRNNLAARGVCLPPPDGHRAGFTLKVNESWLAADAGALHEAFCAAL